MTSLLSAVFYNNIEMIKLLIALGADVNVAGENDVAPLFFASANNNIEAVRLFLSLGADVNKSNNKGQTPLLIACISNNIAIVKALLAAGADANVMDNNGNTPLSIATEKHYKELENLLRKHLQDALVKELTREVVPTSNNTTEIDTKK
ncbi:MAG: ankyrin repeat domain-containing protein [Candidatus Dependentiae bacterium]|nr:ankyrin repeat domain-containing protein [Candidatus Dependentiae bacterium]